MTISSGNLKAGLNSMRGAKMRNFWTMLGVIIGVASVITVVGIGEGIKDQISGQIHRLGSNLITIQPSTLGGDGNYKPANANLLSGSGIAGTLTSTDYTTVSTTKGVTASAPLSAVDANVQGQNGVYKGGLVIGTTNALSSLLNQSVAYGVFLTDDDNGQNAAVLGAAAAQALFKEDVPLGSSFSIDGQQFVVRGIFNQFATTPLNQSVDLNDAIYIPYDVAQTITNNTAVTFQILARANPNPDESTGQIQAAINSGLLTNHGGQHNFSVTGENQNLVNSNDIVDLLTRLISGVAAISLLVGGIGIMNVMLVSVTERMHEIGIRKALGATNRQIHRQFITEAVVISVSGGAIGIIIAFLIDAGLRVTTSLQPEISWQLVLLATGVSLAVGIIFGSIPAYKAARKAPIEALRAY
jgi:putative ABC transport system permease protein